MGAPEFPGHPWQTPKAGPRVALALEKSLDSENEMQVQGNAPLRTAGDWADQRGTLFFALSPSAWLLLILFSLGSPEPFLFSPPPHCPWRSIHRARVSRPGEVQANLPPAPAKVCISPLTVMTCGPPNQGLLITAS